MENTRDQLKNKFKKGDKPTEVDYADLIDSFVNKSEDSYFTLNDLPIASTTKAGVVKQATLSDVDAGKDKSRYITPEGVKRAINKFTPVAPVTSVNGEVGKIIIPDYTRDDTVWENITLSPGVL